MDSDSLCDLRQVTFPLWASFPQSSVGPVLSKDPTSTESPWLYCISVKHLDSNLGNRVCLDKLLNLCMPQSSNL